MSKSSTLSDSVIKKWAYKNTSKNSDINFENLPAFIKYSDLLISLVSDPNCQQRAFILSTLYSFVGKAISQHNTEEIAMINTLLTKASKSHDDIIIKWVNRSKLIMKDLRKYDYAEWCGGGFVRRDLG